MAVARPGDDVPECKETGPDRFQRRFDPDEVVVPRGCMEPEHHLGHHKEDSPAFDVCVTHAVLPYEVRAANLAPDEIVRVVHHAHLVSLGVAHAQF